MGNAQEKLADLLTYVEQVVRLSERPAFSVRAHKNLLFFEHRSKLRSEEEILNWTGPTAETYGIFYLKYAEIPQKG
jgi:hypothetical protein